MTTAVPHSGRPVWQMVALGVGGVLAAIGLGWLLSGLPGSGIDMYYSFRTPAVLWLSGKTQLNDGVPGGDFYHPPWAIPVVALFAAWPFRIGIALLAAVTLIMLGAGALIFSREGPGRPWALAFAVFNLHTFDLLYRGQLSGFEVAGVGLGWLAYRRRNPWLMGLAYFVLMLIPPNTIPLALFLAWITWRHWLKPQWAVSFVIPAGVVLASLAAFGWWPPRWVANEIANPHQVFFLITVWRMAEQLALPVAVPWVSAAAVLVLAAWAWRRAEGAEQPDLARLMLVIGATLLVTPYSLSYRLVLLTACVMPFLSGWRLDVLAGLYALTFLPLLRLAIGRENSWIDLGFVAAVYAATVVYASRARPQE